MTICVSAICENGRAVVYATDRLLTAGLLVAEFEHPGSKAYSLGSTCIGLAAGDALYGHDLFIGCQAMLASRQSPSMAEIAEAVRSRYSALRARTAEEMILAPRGLTMGEFYQGGLVRQLPPEMAFNIDQGIQGARLPLQVMLAGLDSSGAHLYGVNDPGSIDNYDRIGYQAVGSGETHALLMLVAREHKTDNDLQTTAYLVYEAKRKAEVAPGVGAATEVGIIDAQGIWRVTDDAIAELQAAYDDVYSTDRDRLASAVQELSLGKERTPNDEPGERAEAQAPERESEANT